MPRCNEALTYILAIRYAVTVASRQWAAFRSFRPERRSPLPDDLVQCFLPS
jgi:hypothetical protein